MIRDLHRIRRQLDEERVELVCGRVAPSDQVNTEPNAIVCEDCRRATMFELGQD